MRTRNPAALDVGRIRIFIQQVDASIVKCLTDINYKPIPIPNFSLPPDSILEAFGISKELCRLANIQLLFHTPGVAPEMLLKNGIDVRYSKIGSFGRGAYFSDNSYKAMTYFRPEWNVKPDNHHPDHLYMVLSLVALGRVKVYAPGVNEQDIFREPEGYDSVMGTPRDHPEIVVFNNSRILLSYILYYQTTALPPAPRAMAGGVMIPSALKTFFSQLIARAEIVQLGPDIRSLISNLLKGNLTPAEFATQISFKLNASTPSDLVVNLEKQLARVRSTTSSSAPIQALAGPLPQTFVPASIPRSQLLSHANPVPTAVQAAPFMRPPPLAAPSGPVPSVLARSLAAPSGPVPSVLARSLAALGDPVQPVLSQPLAQPSGPFQPVRAPPTAMAASAVKQPTHKTTLVLPSSLKKFFEDIRNRPDLQAHKTSIDQWIFDLVAGKITAAQFLEKIGGLIGCRPPPHLVSELEGQVRMANFKSESQPSFADQ